MCPPVARDIFQWDDEMVKRTLPWRVRYARLCDGEVSRSKGVIRADGLTVNKRSQSGATATGVMHVSDPEISTSLKFVRCPMICIVVKRGRPLYRKTPEKILAIW